jgi:hypothetical protein
MRCSNKQMSKCPWIYTDQIVLGTNKKQTQGCELSWVRATP